MGGDSSSSSSTENYTDNSRTTKIEDRRASATDSAISVTGDRSRVVKQDVSADVVRRALDAARRTMSDASDNARRTAGDAIQANRSVSETAAREVADATRRTAGDAIQANRSVSETAAREANESARTAVEASEAAVRSNEDVTRSALEVGGNALNSAFDFAEFTQGGLQDATGDAIQVATEEATDDAKEIVSQFGRYGLLAGVAVTAIIVIWGNRS